MKAPSQKKETTLAVLAHISTFGKYLLPFGNFIFPLIIGAFKQQDRFLDENVKRALNFQISIFLYYVFIAGATFASALIFASGSNMELIIEQNYFYLSEGHFGLPFYSILFTATILVLGLFVLDLVSVIKAALRASDHQVYKYPLAIPFIKSSNQLKNEQFNNNTKNETL